MRPFETAWTLMKSRTFRDQSGDWGSPHRSGEAKQPYTNLQVKQRVPLVGGAPRFDRNYEERSDVTTHPRYQEQAAMRRDMASDVEADEPFEEPETDEEVTAAHDYKNQRALEQQAAAERIVREGLGEHAVPNNWNNERMAEFVFRNDLDSINRQQSL